MNIKNRTLFTGDNFEILRGFDSECVDLVYLDPPFNSNKNYSAPIGSKAAGAAFKDTWTYDDVTAAQIGLLADKSQPLSDYVTAVGKVAGKSMAAYLTMMAVRLLEMQRVLKPTGSLYLHCDPTASHYLKGLLDSIFGRTNFRNEIVWAYSKWTNTASYYQRNHDVILYYAASSKTVFRKQFGPPSEAMRQIRKRGYNGGSQGGRKILRVYDASKPKVAQKIRETEAAGGTVYYVNNPAPGNPIPDYWTDLPNLGGGSKERVGYPTQKPLKLLDRVIRGSSNVGDIVLDPFCGCATTLVAAERLSRKWIGIDLSPLAVDLVKTRLRDARPLLYKVHDRTDIPHRSDLGKPRPYQTNKRTLFGEQMGRCKICNRPMEFQLFHIDHVVPRVKGGTDHLENLQLLCGHCNLKKGSLEQHEAVAKLQKEGWILPSGKETIQ